VLTSIPYQVGKNGLVEKIAEAAKDKRIEGISDIRDEIEPRGRARRRGPEARCHARGGAQPDLAQHPCAVVLPGQHARHPWRPPGNPGPQGHHHQLRRFREEVITRRTKFELNKARDRAHILLGLVIAVTNLDEVVRIIRGSANPPPPAPRCCRANGRWAKSPHIRLVEAIEDDADELSAPTYRLSEIQVKAILDLRLHRLTALGRDEIGDELEKLAMPSPNISRSWPTA
jgi:DNA gyrase subunit A